MKCDIIKSQIYFGKNYIPGVTIPDKYNASNNTSRNEFPQTGLSSLYSTDKKLFMRYARFFEKINHGYETAINELQNNAGIEVYSKKVKKTKDDFHSIIVLRKKIHPDGTYTQSRTELAADEEETFERCFYKGSKEIFQVSYGETKNGNLYINNRMKITLDDNNEPKEIEYSRLSDILPYVYETKKYTLADYDEDVDVINGIKNGTLQGGEPISQVSQTSDGTITLNQNFEANGCKIHRTYTQRKDSNEYSFYIDDENGKPIFKLDRSFRKNPDGTTTARINDREYNIKFDDDRFIAFITDNEGTKKVINLRNKIYHFTEEKIKACYEFLKTLPADKLLAIDKYVNFITLKNDKGKSSYKGLNRNLITMGYLSILSHELGHAIDPNIFYDGKLSGNKELVQIYNEEMLSFNKTHTEGDQIAMDYLGQMGGGKFSTGIGEMLADIEMFLTTYGYNSKELASRSEFIIRNFPKTISKVASMTSYNAIKE